METNGIQNANISFAGGAVKRAGVSPSQGGQVAAAPQGTKETTVSQPVAQDRAKVEASIERRLAVLRELANLYAVSDTRFTIYKQNGEFFTKVTNLRDGSVTTIPEPELLASVADAAGVIIETSA